MQKLYYSISEISKLLDEEQHILRYWEKEFEQLKPRKNRGGNRVYSDKDFLLLKLIKKLLRIDKLSIKGAKEQLDKLYTNFPNESESLFANSMDYSEFGYFKENYANSEDVQTLSFDDVKEIKFLLEDVLLYLRK